MTTSKTARAKRRHARAARHATIAENLAVQERAAASKPNARRRFIQPAPDVEYTEYVAWAVNADAAE